MELNTIMIVALAAGFLLASLFGDSKPGGDRGELMFEDKQRAIDGIMRRK